MDSLNRLIVYLCIISFLLNGSGYCALDFNYHNYASITSILQGYVAQYPNKAYLYSIGKSIGNRELWVLALSDSNPDKHITLRPEAKYVGNMHGNEASSKEILLHLIDYMLNNQNTDSNVDYLMKNTRIHILVSMNPDGYELSSERDCDGLNGRYNGNYYDLNRNFPDLFECNLDPIQIETRHIMDWLDSSSQFILSANFHSGSVVANYPYDNYVGGSSGYSRDNPTDENDLFKALAKNYSFSHSNMRYDPCHHSFTEGVTNGARWYPIIGGMQDYNYWKHGCYEITIEITCCKFPDASKLSGIWLENQNALINYMKLANTGVRGIVNFYNGEPAAHVSIQINTIEPIFKTDSNGEYYRLALPGSYKLKVLLDCTQIYTTDFTVPAGSQLKVLNITLNEANYTKYRAKVNSLNKNAKFCTLSRQPVDCGTDSTDTTETHETTDNQTLNGLSRISASNYSLFFIIISVYIYFNSKT